MMPQEEYLETELGLLPNDWSIEKLGNFVKTYSGGTPSRANPAYWTGNIPWAKSGELNDRRMFKVEESISEEGLRNSSAKFAEENDLLVALYGATAGKVGLAKSKFTVNQAICVIKPNERFLTDFYFFYFIFIREKILSQRYGGAQPNISQQTVKNLIIPVPPIQEQGIIALILTKIQDAKEKSELVLYSLREFKKSLMKHLFTYGAVCMEDASKVKLKETEIGQEPEDWELKKLCDLVQLKKDIVAGPFGSNIGKRFFVKKGIPLIRGNNLTLGKQFFVDRGFVFITEEKALELISCEALPTDLIFTSAGTVGQVGVIPKDSIYPKYIISNKQMRARLDKTKVSELYAYYWFSSSVGQSLILSQKRGSSIPVINLSILRNLLVPIPPIEEQRKICHILTTVDKRIEVEKNKLATIDNFFKSLMSNLMSAKIRVNNLEL